jgi:hypothetical protein
MIYFINKRMARSTHHLPTGLNLIVNCIVIDCIVIVRFFAGRGLQPSP